MPTIVARPVVYDSPTLLGGGGYFFREVIRAGALAKALDGDVVALRDHNPSLLLARASSGTLKLRDDALALNATIDVPETAIGQDTFVLTARGDLRGGSFSFRVAKDGEEWRQGDDDVPVRVITECSHLFDISLCTFPAYGETQAWVRSAVTSPAAAARRRSLELLARQIFEVERFGRRIPPPAWYRSRRLQRRGCGHVVGVSGYSQSSFDLPAPPAPTSGSPIRAVTG